MEYKQTYRQREQVSGYPGEGGGKVGTRGAGAHLYGVWQNINVQLKFHSVINYLDHNKKTKKSKK